jgi:hypothetical protein
MLAVYMDDMIFTFGEKTDYIRHLYLVFFEVRKHNMRLNSEKCIPSRSKREIFWGFYITKQGVEASPDKCRANITMDIPPERRDSKHSME